MTLSIMGLLKKIPSARAGILSCPLIKPGKAVRKGFLTAHPRGCVFQQSLIREFSVKAFTIVFLFIVGLIVFPGSRITAASPIEVIGAAFDFGNVPFGSIVTHKVLIVNHTDSMLRITNVHPGCGCTQIPLTRKEVAVGDSLEIELLLNTGKVVRGRFEKSPEIMINNVQTPKITVKMTGFNYGSGDLTNLIRVNPETVALSKKGGKDNADIEIRNRGPREVFARLLTPRDTTLFRVTMPTRPILANRSEKIVVKLNPSCKDTDFKKSFTFYLTDDKQTRYTIPVTLTL